MCMQKADQVGRGGGYHLLGDQKKLERGWVFGGGNSQWFGWDGRPGVCLCLLWLDWPKKPVYQWPTSNAEDKTLVGLRTRPQEHLFWRQNLPRKYNHLHLRRRRNWIFWHWALQPVASVDDCVMHKHTGGVALSGSSPAPPGLQVSTWEDEVIRLQI